MKNICIVNTSYLKESKTIFLVNSFIDGMKSVKPELNVHTLNIAEWEISNCTGCGNCWFNENDNCVYEDDFTKNIEIISKSDLIIFSCPIWVGSGNHLFRTFTERLISLVEPGFVFNGTKLGHAKKKHVNLNTLLLFSTCAMTGIHNFDPIIQHVKSLEYLANIKYIGAILKAQSLEIPYYTPEEKIVLKNKCFNAGENFQISGKIESSIIDDIFRPKLEVKKYIELINKRQNNISKKYRNK